MMESGDFEIISVVVTGELPDNCHECFLTQNLTSRGCYAIKCGVSYENDGQRIVEDFWDTRPDWCPLVIESVNKE